ncbi:MAG: phosphohydrolase [Solirubrobacterales bacterium]|jgi:HD superfamily phosphohydrolase|nr:phosphohydrolase [Solirubrobacterales bacterium]
MAPRGGKIKDPIHGYIPFTRIEREFLDDPMAQRLRWISQSSLAHYVFPEVRTSRFAHSVGTMHLSSRFLASALRNTEEGLRKRLEAATKQAVEHAAQVPDDVDAVRRLLVADGLLAGASVSDAARPYMLLAEQGLRLASLFHDLGHLPFSHDFEYALGRLFDQDPERASARFGALYAGPESGGPALHEIIGYQLAGALFEKLHERVFQATELDTLARCVVVIAEQILLASPPDGPELAITPHNELDDDTVWWLLHSLMAGELDVDRCDYLLRDARAYGFEFASYDVDRVVDNLVVSQPRADRAFLALAVRAQGVSAAESYLVARFRAYQWGPFHHKVAQLAAALQHCTREILREALDHPGDAPEIDAFLHAMQTIADGDRRRLHLDEPAALDAFVGYDDIWWLTVLRERARRAPDDRWLQLVCFRQPGPRSLWKRPDQFPGGDLAAFNRGLPGREDVRGQARWNAVVDELAPGVLVSRQRFSPWRRQRGSDPPASNLQVLSEDRGMIPLTELSYVTSALRPAWEHDVQVQAFSIEDRDAVSVVEHLRTGLTTHHGH